MKLQSQLADIKNNKLAPIYLVQGTEQYLVEKIKRTFTEVVLDEADEGLNFGQFNMTDSLVESAIAEAETYPFFGDKRLVFIHEPGFLTAEKAKSDLDHDLNQLMAYAQNPADFTVLVIFANYEKLDKRKKVTKTLMKEAVVIDANPLEEKDLINYIDQYVSAQGYSFEKGALPLLIERTNANLTAMMGELSKLFLFHYDEKVITSDAINQLVNRSLESNVFSINDHVLSGNVQAAISVFNDLLLQKEEPIKIIAIMITQFRLLLQVKILRSKGYQQAEIAQTLKVHPYRVKLAMQKEKAFSQNALSTAYRYLIDADDNIKTGKLSSDLQFELFVMQFKDSALN